MNSRKREYDVSKVDDGQRLDLFLMDSLKHVSIEDIKKVIDSGGVYVNRKRTLDPSFSLKSDDHVEFYYNTDKKNITLNKKDIIYEDKHLIAIEKPAGVPSQATYASIKGTALEIVENYYKNNGKDQYLRLIHRLDKGTTGVLVLSKTPEASKALTDQFRGKKIEKEYLALVQGTVKPSFGTIKTCIAKEKSRGSKYANVESGGKEAVSEYELAEKLNGYSLVTVRPKTGRTHQIRVHMAHIGHPILGDKLYGGLTRLLLKTKEKLHDIDIARPMLHAASLTLTHPVTKKVITLRAKMPGDMKDIVELLS